MKLTDFLILLCTVSSIYVWDAQGTFALYKYAFSEYALFHGGYYTLLTALFVHVNFVHLIGNMLFLYIFGHILEDDVGPLCLAAVFFTSGILAFILSIPFYPGEKMLGASAAIFAVMAAVLLVRQPGYSLQFLSPIGPLTLLFFIFNIIAIQNGQQENVAYIAHIIGFIIGLFFGIRWNKQWVKSLMYTLVLLVIYVIIFNYLKSVNDKVGIDNIFHFIND